MKISSADFNTGFLRFVLSLILTVSFLPDVCFADNQNLISEGDQALAQNDLDSAEKLFTEAVKMNPEGYRALKALAEIKFELSKFEEADGLIDRLLSLEITGGRNVLIFTEKDKEPLSGELIDEKVLVMVSEGVKPGKFQKLVPRPQENYRVFLLNEGKVRLFPKNKVKLKYIGIPHVIWDQVLDFQKEVKKKLVSGTGIMSADQLAEYIQKKIKRNDQVLKIRSKPIGDQGAKLLSESPLLRELKTLVLSDTLIGDEGIRALANSTVLTKLNILEMENNQISNQGLQYIAESENLSGLKVLNLYHNRISDAGAMALANSETLTRLNEIILSYNAIGDQGAIHLTESSRLGNLEKLELMHNPLGKNGLEASIRFNFKQKFKRLHQLGTLNNLENHYIGDMGVLVLLDSSYLDEMIELNLNYNNLTDAAVRALAHSPKLAHLISLSLVGNKIADQGASALAESKTLNSLRRLILDFNYIGDEGARAFANSKSLPSLEWLKLEENQIGSAGSDALSGSRNLDKLTQPIFGFH